MFNGFTRKTSEFMWELSFNNERPWFQAHRQEYEECLNVPFKALANDTFALMCDRHPDVSFHLHISRIYRDARRLRGRGPYHDRLWFSIQAEEKDYEGPVFWFELSPAEYAFGMGTWGIPAFLEQYRKRIDANPAEFERIITELDRYPELIADLEGYKRPKGDYPPPLGLWYNCRHPGLACKKEFGGDLLTSALPGILADNYDKLFPLFSYLLSVYYMQENKK